MLVLCVTDVGKVSRRKLMHANLIKVLQDIRASYWFLPTLMALFAFALSFVMQWLDSLYDIASLHQLHWLTTTNVDGARSVLSVIAGSVMGVAGVTFSITIVAVSYASTNFGPRLIGNFMRDRGNQITLGIFIATFVYCLMILRTIKGGAGGNGDTSLDLFVPHLSILMALALALSSISVLIYFIHHVPETINVGNIAAKIGADLRTDILKLFPEPAKLKPENPAKDFSWDHKKEDWSEAKICAGEAGYIQTLDLERLTRQAHANRVLIKLTSRPGDFVVAQDCVLAIYSEQEIDDETRNSLNNCFAIGQHRTAHQNILFLVDELVEVISRALSPGVNDPYTAITCFNWLKASIVCFALEREQHDLSAEQSLIKIKPVDFKTFTSAIFDQTRQSVCTDRNISIHVLKILGELTLLLKKKSEIDILLEQMKELNNACKQELGTSNAYKDVQSCYEEAQLLHNNASNSAPLKWFN